MNIALGRQIACGNFSHVYYGTSAQLGEVCVKFLRPPRTERDESFRNKNFEREVTLMRCVWEWMWCGVCVCVCVVSFAVHRSAIPRAEVCVRVCVCVCVCVVCINKIKKKTKQN